MPVLVDVPTISVALVGASVPQSVQVAVGGLAAGQAVTVTGTAGSFTWLVRGGSVQLDTEQLILTDAATPIGVPITYTVTVEGESFVSAPITVPFDGRYVLQSLDGRVAIPFVWQSNGDPRDLHLRTSVLPIPGRSRPVVRWDGSAGESGQMRIRTSRTTTDALLAHLRDRGPVMLLRTDGAVRDLDAVAYIAITDAPRVLWGAVVGPGQLSTDRVWTLSFEVIDDPEPGTVLPTSTGADFDTVYAALTGDDFDAEWAGSTWLEFDREDWSAH